MASRMGISNTFTVNTIEDAVSVEAQYSPDQTIIHTTWQDGDIYMRTRESDSSVWSAWHKIVGENGDETDFKFNISANKTTANATTPPSDISTWYDAPIAITAAKPYLWSRVQHKSWNASTQSYSVDSTRYIRLTGEDGKSVTYDSEHSSISYGVSIYGAPNSQSQDYPTDITTWYTTVPAMQKGKYLWTRDITAYNNGGTLEYTTTYGVSYWGIDGDSVEIDTSRTYVRYSTQKTSTQPPDSTFTLTTPPSLSQGDYLWILSQTAYVGVSNPLKAYSVSRVGTDGDEGDPGADGYTTHFAYATSADGSQNFSTTNFSGATYIGTYRDRNAQDSQVYTDYTWTKWKGDDGYTVQAQYAPNDNPTASQIHTTWMSGDLYMRTKQSNESTWSAWHRIVGEDGDETNFTFGISAYKTTASASTPPSDISTWSDAPLAVTSSKPYLWSKVQKKTWNASTQSYDVVSTTYIRLTGEDGASVQAQYAPNNNPTTSQIHNTFQTGDLYMRTRSTSDNTWSAWQRIVGENGKETDYRFAISAYTVPSANGYPADLGAGDSYWSDAPVPVTAAKPYLWSRVQKKNSAGSVTSTSYIRLTGEKGTSPYFADIDNEMDVVMCNKYGYPVVSQTILGNVQMFHGSDAEPFTTDTIKRNGSTLTWDGNNNGVWPTWNGNTKTLSVEFDTTANIQDIDVFELVVKSTNNNTITATLHFSVTGSRSNVIYRLVPSASCVLKKKDGTYTPSTNITCSVLKIENGEEKTPSASEYTLKKSVNGGAEENYSATAPSAITSDLKFILYIDSVLVDKETIPLVTDGDNGDDGEDGEDAAVAFATPDKVSIPCNSNGAVASAVSQSVTFSLRVGSHVASVSSVSSGAKPTGVTVTSAYYNAAIINVATTATASGLGAGVTFTVQGTYNNKTYSANITVALIGATSGESIVGPRGKVGRFYYYAQEWTNDPSISYDVTDTEAPYFSYNNNYWVFNPDENGTYTMQQMGAPSSSSEDWEIMVTDFKYIISEAIFSQNAHLGSFIVSGDWLLSQHGKVDGSDSTNYALFDPYFARGNSLCRAESITVSYKNIGAATYIGGKTYQIKVVAENMASTTSSAARLNVRMYNGSSTIGSTLTITAPNSVGTISFTPPTTGVYYLRCDMNASGMTCSVTASVSNVFVPNYAVDALQGASYQHEGYFGGVIESEDVVHGNKFLLDVNNGSFQMIGPDVVKDSDHSLPEGNSREVLAEMAFATDGDTLTRMATMLLQDGHKRNKLTLDPQLGISMQGYDFSSQYQQNMISLSYGSGSSERGLRIDADGVAVRNGSTWIAKSWEQIFNNQ